MRLISALYLSRFFNLIEITCLVTPGPVISSSGTPTCLARFLSKSIGMKRAIFCDIGTCVPSDVARLPIKSFLEPHGCAPVWEHNNRNVADDKSEEVHRALFCSLISLLLLLLSLAVSFVLLLFFSLLALGVLNLRLRLRLRLLASVGSRTFGLGLILGETIFFWN